MYNAIVILIVVASVLMCLIVLIQESKGGGLASGFADNNAMLGVRKTTDVVEKTTWGLAAVMVILSILSVAFLGNFSASNSAIMEQAVEQQATNPNNLPGIEAGAQTDKNAAEPAAAPADTPAQYFLN